MSRRLPRACLAAAFLTACSGGPTDTGLFKPGSGDDTGDSSPPVDTFDTGGPDDTDSGETDDTHETGETGETGETAEPEVTLVINEFMADNETSWSPDDETWPDWVELYNAGSEAVDLVGWSITDDVEQPDMSPFDGSLGVEPGGFALLIADGDPAAGVEHVNFKLSSDGEEIALINPDGRRVDWVRFPEQTADVAAARVVDGSEDDGWEYVPYGTPGESNGG